MKENKKQQSELEKDVLSILSSSKGRACMMDLLRSEECRKYLTKLWQSWTAKEDSPCISSEFSELERENKLLKENLNEAEKSRQELVKKQSECLVTAEQQVSAAEEQLSATRSQLDEVKEQLSVTRSQLDEAKEQLSASKGQIKELEKECAAHKKQLDAYQNSYGKPDQAYKDYQALSADTRYRLRNIFETDHPLALIAAGASWENVEGVWGFARRRIIENELEDVQVLVRLFEFLFEVYVSQSASCGYCLLRPQQGDRYDADLHSILGTKTDGTVSRVRLCGVQDQNTGKVLQKAVIEVMS